MAASHAACTREMSPHIMAGFAPAPKDDWAAPSRLDKAAMPAAAPAPAGPPAAAAVPPKIASPCVLNPVDCAFMVCVVNHCAHPC